MPFKNAEFVPHSLAQKSESFDQFLSFDKLLKIIHELKKERKCGENPCEVHSEKEEENEKEEDEMKRKKNEGKERRGKRSGEQEKEG